MGTCHPAQRALALTVYQGASSDPRRNAVLGVIDLPDLEPAPEGEDSRPIRVEFRHDIDGLVQIEVTDVWAGHTVRGQVAADGDEQAELRARAEESWGDLELGKPGAAPAPEHAATPSWDAAGIEPMEADEAAALFTSVLDRAKELRVEHPDAASALVALAEQGTAHLEAGDEPGVVARYEALSDALFEHGIYL